MWAWCVGRDESVVWRGMWCDVWRGKDLDMCGEGGVCRCSGWRERSLCGVWKGRVCGVERKGRVCGVERKGFLMN